MIKTVLIDDHKLFQEGIERLLEGSGLFQIIEKFSDGYSLLENLTSLNFGLHDKVVRVSHLCRMDYRV